MSSSTRFHSKASDLSGATLNLRQYFEVSAPTDYPTLLRSLRQLLPAGSTLYFEGVAVSAAAIATFGRFAADPPHLKVSRGTIVPTPKVFRVGMTDEALSAIADLFRNHASMEICEHFHAYRADTILLQWHDAFYRDPVLLAGLFDETTIARFCAVNHCEYVRKFERGS